MLVTVPPMAANSPSAVRKAREASHQVKGVRLFNLIPRDLRDKKNVTVDNFTSGLDAWLSTVSLMGYMGKFISDPDKPNGLKKLIPFLRDLVRIEPDFRDIILTSTCAQYKIINLISDC